MARVGILIFMSILLLSQTPIVWALEKEPFKIGAVIPLSGRLRAVGDEMEKSYRLAVDKINNAGGIFGVPLRLITADSHGNPDKAAEAVRKLIEQDGVIVLTGGVDSDCAYEAARIAQRLRTPFVVSAAEAEKITTQGWEQIFRIAGASHEVSTPVESFITAGVEKPATVAVLHEDTLTETSHAQTFKKHCEQLGIKVVHNVAYDAGSTNLKTLLLIIKAAKPDMLYVAAEIDGAVKLVKTAEEIRFAPKIFVGIGGGFNREEFGKRTGSAAEYVMSVGSWGLEVYHKYAWDYCMDHLKRYGELPGEDGAMAYASIQVLADALERAKRRDGESMREAISHVDMTTVFGMVRFISYERKKRQNYHQPYLIQWQKGTMEIVWPPILATRPAVYPFPQWRDRKPSKQSTN